eukprot:TRINITY_DN1015_c1_g2_i1.p1 TRINITY_DN1015_c1_g2~~TRINITY_DN1015_c1_g2_i1.p1  ORF type:complete len:399 (+),score=162.69 TRINITY_DN1015_c1_g2_i1:91-1287(+)
MAGGYFSSGSSTFQASDFSGGLGNQPPSPFGQHGGVGPSGMGGPGTAPAAPIPNMTPLTCRQVLSAAADKTQLMRIGDKVVHHVAVMGYKRGWRLEGNNIAVCIDDGTGIIHAKLFNQTGAHNGLKQALQEEERRAGMRGGSEQDEHPSPIVCAFGDLSMQVQADGKRRVEMLAFQLRLSRSIQELLHHLMLASYTARLNKEGPLPPRPFGSGQGGAAPSMASVPGLAGISQPQRAGYGSPGQMQQFGSPGSMRQAAQPQHMQQQQQPPQQMQAQHTQQHMRMHPQHMQQPPMQQQQQQQQQQPPPMQQQQPQHGQFGSPPNGGGPQSFAPPQYQTFAQRPVQQAVKNALHGGVSCSLAELQRRVMDQGFSEREVDEELTAMKHSGTLFNAGGENWSL